MNNHRVVFQKYKKITGILKNCKHIEHEWSLNSPLQRFIFLYESTIQYGSHHK